MRCRLCWHTFRCADPSPCADQPAHERDNDVLAGILAGVLRPDERAVYAGLLTLRLLDLFAHLWPDRLTRAIGWCESILAPSWR